MSKKSKEQQEKFDLNKKMQLNHYYDEHDEEISSTESVSNLEELKEELQKTSAPQSTQETSPLQVKKSWYPRILTKLSQEHKTISEEQNDSKETKTSSVETMEELKPLPKKQSFADRLPQLHKVRKRRLIGKLSLLIGSFLLIIMITLYFISPYSKLGKIIVKGNHQVATETILKDSALKLKGGLWQQVWQKKEAAKKVVDQEVWIKEAKVSFQWWNQLTISVEEYQKQGLLVGDHKYYPILENGVVLKQQSQKLEEGYPLLKDFKNQQYIAAFLKEYQQLPKDIQSLISEITYTGNAQNKKQITLEMEDGNQVIAQLDEFSHKLLRYPQVVAQMKEKGIVDMEAGIFTTPFPKKNSSDENKEKTQDSSKTKTSDSKKVTKNQEE